MGRSAQRTIFVLNGETYSLAERGTEASLNGAQTLEQEGNAEQIDLVLVHVDINASLVDELVVNAESTWKAESNLRRRA